MTTPSYLELVAAVRREGEAIVSSCRQGIEVADAPAPTCPVPTCPGWTAADLCRHVGSIYAHVGTVLRDRVTSSPGERAPAPDDVDPVDYLAECLDELVEALSACDPNTPVWNWSTQPDEAVFWARRMAHESAVHRFDAQRAHGVAQPVDDELAADGLDELVDVIAPVVLPRTPALADVPETTYGFTSAGESAGWQLALGPAGLRRVEALRTPDVAVRGTASALLLAAYNRVPWSSLDVEGDSDALSRWSSLMQF